MHVCLFDIDGTLLNSGGAGQAAMEAALASEFEAVEPLEGISTAGRTDRAIVADMFRYHGIEPDEDRLQRFMAAYLRHLPDRLTERDGSALPGIPLLLEMLGPREDVLLGLLTGNFQDGARLKLTHFHLDHHFEFGGFGDRHHERDDVAREALDEVHKRCNGSVDPSRVWVIGDTPADIRCARAIGVNVVAVATGVYSAEQLEGAEPDHLFADFADPDPLLNLLD